MSVFPVVKGVRLRATKINRCGLPIAGNANRLVTDGFVSVRLNPVMKDANELEQENAEGKVCVVDRTPPTRKYHSVELELCNVNTGLISMFNGWSQIIDHANNPIGFVDSANVDDQFGVALEIWTGGRTDEDCEPQKLDTVFSNPTTGINYGYLLFGATEFTLGNIEIGANISTFTLTGITIPIPHWGRGPYNVASTNATGTPGRLLAPADDDAHFMLFRTPVPPPAPTPGNRPARLQTSTLFTGTTYYFGGPTNAPAAAVAPAQTDA